MKEIKNNVIKFVKDYVENAHAKGVILGMSGGKDSFVVASICVQAIGKEKVFGLIMPRGDQKEDVKIAIEECELLGMNYQVADISKLYDQTVELSKQVLKTEELSSVSTLNISPRLRMNLLYSVGGTLGYLVANTSNLSERMVGYTTKWGDSVGDFAPLLGLTKSEVCELGLELGLPEKYVNKKPADGLTGKTDEDVMGFSYDELDDFIRNGKISKNHEKILRMHKNSNHKRQNITSFDPKRKNYFEN